ncbi:6008_t:CDS:2, partial [Funneliformis mosseae]
DIWMDLSKRDNTLQTLRYLLDSGSDIRYDKYIRTNLLLQIDIEEESATENNSNLKISSIYFDFQNI